MTFESPVDARPDRHEPYASMGRLPNRGGPRASPLVRGWSGKGQDRDICDYARRHGYVLLTNDLDFPQILAHTREAGPSVILVRGEPLVPESRGAALLRAMHVCHEEISRGAIVTLDWSDRPRARVLPLRWIPINARA
jgi:predicted nuclease of predicted toxin-antitoxin system